MRENVFISAMGGALDGAVQTNGGTATIETGSASSTTILTETLSTVLDRHADFDRPRFVKIDTDGFDCPILSGELDLLSRVRPVLFFEYDPAYDAVSLSIFDELRAIGYASILIYDNSGDYMLHCSLGDRSLLEDIHGYYTGRGHARYCDVCVFHAIDSDVAELAAASERSASGASRLLRRAAGVNICRWRAAIPELLKNLCRAFSSNGR